MSWETQREKMGPKNIHRNIAWKQKNWQKDINLLAQDGSKIFLHMHASSVIQVCPTLCALLDCSPIGSSVHGIFQARKLEWDAISSSKGSSQPRDRTQVSWIFCTGRQILYHWATWEAAKSFLPKYIVGNAIGHWIERISRMSNLFSDF